VASGFDVVRCRGIGSQPSALRVLRASEASSGLFYCAADPRSLGLSRMNSYGCSNSDCFSLTSVFALQPIDKGDARIRGVVALIER
jgi:hypothetical protein